MAQYFRLFFGLTDANDYFCIKPIVMKSKLLLLIFSLSAILSSPALEPVAKLWVTMPDSIMPSVEVNRRKDMIDLIHAGQTAQSTTKLGGTATLTKLQDNTLSIDLSSKSKMDMRLYQTHRNDTLIVLVNTVYAPAGNSRIRVFDPAWNELPVSKYIRPIPTAEFFTIPDTLAETQKKELLQIAEVYLVEFSFEADGSLRARPSWEKYLDPKSFEKIKPYLREAITLRWNGKKLL